MATVVYSNGPVTGRPTSARADVRSRLDATLLRLPQPLHLYEFLIGRGHYHFGWFERASDALSTAQDRLVVELAGQLRRGMPVLDVGCGLGGSVALLCGMGFSCRGVDPVLPAIAYARAAWRGVGNATFEIGTLADDAGVGVPAVGNVVLIEVLHRFDDLSRLLRDMRRVLVVGGRAVIADVVVRGGNDGMQLPFATRGRLAAVAADAGFEVVAVREATEQVLPTLPRLTAQLRTERSRIETAFARRRPAIRDEMAELGAQLAQLQCGFENGALSYETLVLRRVGGDA